MKNLFEPTYSELSEYIFSSKDLPHFTNPPEGGGGLKRLRQILKIMAFGVGSSILVYFSIRASNIILRAAQERGGISFKDIYSKLVSCVKALF